MPSTGTTWSRFDVAAATALYLSGRSCQQVADQLGFSRGYVATRLRRAGVAMRPARRPAAPFPGREEVDALRREGASWAAIGRLAGLSASSAQRRYAAARARAQAADPDEGLDSVQRRVLIARPRRGDGSQPREPVGSSHTSGSV